MKRNDLITIPKYGVIETFRIVKIGKSIVFVVNANGKPSWLHKSTVLQYNKNR